jgi:hypothetical protein
MKKLAVIAILAIALCLSGTALANGNWGVDYPIALGLQNSSTIKVSNVQSTQGWNITFENGQIVPLETINIDPIWVIAINITDGKVTPLVPMEWYAFNESFNFKDDKSKMNAFKITDAANAVTLGTEFIPSVPELSTATVCNNTQYCIDGFWRITQQNNCGPIIPKEVNVIGDYKINGQPTGFVGR